MWRSSSLEKILMLGTFEGKRRRGQQRIRCFDIITDPIDINLSKFQDFPHGAKWWKNLPANTEDLRDASLVPGSGRYPGGSHNNPLQYSCLENPMDRGTWWATVHGVAKSRTRLSDFTFTVHSTGNYSQYPVKNHNGKEYQGEYAHSPSLWITLLYSWN